MFYFAAIRVEDAVTEIHALALGRLDQQQLVKADAKMAVAQLADGLGGKLQFLAYAIEHDEVVSKALHLGKGQIHISTLRIVVLRLNGCGWPGKMTLACCAH